MRRSLTFLALFALAEGSAHAKPCPNIMLVLDASTSMAQDPMGNDPPQGMSKFALLQEVIVSVVQEYGDHVPFGLEFIQSDGKNQSDDTQCYADAKINVPLSHSSASDIIAKIKAATTSRNTNTGEAVTRAAMEASLMSNSKPNYIVLVTDGAPNCLQMDSFLVSQEDYYNAPTCKAIEAAVQQKPTVKTFVIGFDGGTNDQEKGMLDAMSFKGGVEVPGCGGFKAGTPCYYQAGANFQTFHDLFDKIVRDAVTFEFGGAICDDSCRTIPCPKGQICTSDEIDSSAHCVNDPCGGSKCSGNQYCRGGGCVSACGACTVMQKCQDGTCVADPCAGKKACAVGQICNPNDGTCVASPCATCADGSLCDFKSGHCLVDQCKVITCPADHTCVNNGNCVGKASVGGCDAGRGVRGEGFAALALGLVGLAMLVRRRRLAVARRSRTAPRLG